MTTLTLDHDQIGVLIALVVVLLVTVPYLLVRALIAIDAWLDYRYTRESPEEAAWERHCRTTPGLLDLRDEAAWEAEIQFPGPLHDFTRTDGGQA